MPAFASRGRTKRVVRFPRNTLSTVRGDLPSRGVTQAASLIARDWLDVGRCGSVRVGRKPAHGKTSRPSDLSDPSSHKRPPEQALSRFSHRPSPFLALCV
jgi:hypothetical protein